MASLLTGYGCVTVEAVTKQSAVLLFLHGLGDTGHGWASILTEHRPPHVKILCPTASKMSVTVNNGFTMPSWFDIYSLTKGEQEDEKGIRKAVKDVHDALDMLLTSGTPVNRILLGGFSQGGSLAAYAGLTYKQPLAGIVLLSCWVPLNQFLKKEALESNKSIPILQCHGESDPVVKYPDGKSSADLLESINCTNHTFKSYPGLVHTSSEAEMQCVQDWMIDILKPQGGSKF